MREAARPGAVPLSTGEPAAQSRRVRFLAAVTWRAAGAVDSSVAAPGRLAGLPHLW